MKIIIFGILGLLILLFVSFTFTNRVEVVDFEYWEGCETGEGECKPLVFTRQKYGEKWFLQTPCGGTLTDVSLSMVKGNNIILVQEINIGFKDCPPIFELTHLEDGKYYSYMYGCGLGGQIEINLKTKTN